MKYWYGYVPPSIASRQVIPQCRTLSRSFSENPRRADDMPIRDARATRLFCRFTTLHYQDYVQQKTVCVGCDMMINLASVFGFVCCSASLLGPLRPLSFACLFLSSPFFPHVVVQLLSCRNSLKFPWPMSWCYLVCRLPPEAEQRLSC